jgi:hypothetical protein
MTKDTYITEVIFRKFKDGEVIALFPFYIETMDGSIMSYMHIGQHGGASVNLVNITTPAKPHEYADLKTELESIGYNLKIVKRINRKRIYLQLKH